MQINKADLMRVRRAIDESGLVGVHKEESTNWNCSYGCTGTCVGSCNGLCVTGCWGNNYGA